MGGFGAFALWTDSAELGTTGSITTGHLGLEGVENELGYWYLENPQTNTPTDPNSNAKKIDDIDNFVISPGDELSFRGTKYSGYVTGSDIKARFKIAGELGEVLHDDVKNHVKVEFKVNGTLFGANDAVLKGSVGSETAYLGGSSGAMAAVDVYITFLDTTTKDEAQAVTDAIKFTDSNLQDGEYGGLWLVLEQF
jgi:alternate signal-mediated exported protein